MIKLKKNKKFKKIMVIVYISIMLLISGVSLFIIFKTNNTNENYIVTYDSLSDDEKKTLDFITATQKKKSEENPDYVGELVFDSNLINTSVVQALALERRDGLSYSFYSNEGNYVNSFTATIDGCDGRACNPNDIYHRLDWEKMEYSVWGSNYIDYRCFMSDKNIIIYGHHSSGASQAFSRLEDLLLEGNYENNKTFKLFLDNEQRSYEIVSVYVCDVESEDVNYAYHLFYNSKENEEKNIEFINDYNNYLQEKSIYNTGITLKKDDKLVTLSTCIDYEGVPNNEKYRQIVVARETERKIITQ